MQDYHCALELKSRGSMIHGEGDEGWVRAVTPYFLIYQQWHYQWGLMNREPVIQNSGATLAVKAEFKQHFPVLPWWLWEVIKKRGFLAQCCHRSGYYHSGLHSDHQRITGLDHTILLLFRAQWNFQLHGGRTGGFFVCLNKEIYDCFSFFLSLSL